ncbi:MAG: hypothetical protein AB1472_03700 [Candidatus Omnitrophota bacterium]
MMCMPKGLSTFFLMHAIVPLVVSFFVLFVVSKTDKQGLKVFGLVIAVILWVIAALIFSFGLCSTMNKSMPMCSMMSMMQKGQMQNIDQQGVKCPMGK